MKTLTPSKKFARTVITIKTDRLVKTQAQKLAATLGLSLSDVINSSLRQFVRDEALNLSTAPRMTPYLESIIEGAEADYTAGKNVYGPFSTRDELEAFFKTEIQGK
jgi:antitoxin component of RelBE/YafQ-DinJ toxin-antitoxin module